jgi:phage replication-related protein YjqB (UPF0714/DUF867 family)
MSTTFEEIANAYTLNTHFAVVAEPGSDPEKKYLVIGIHGGGIQLYTSDIVYGIAGTRHGFYLFEGFIQDAQTRMHVSSDNYNEPRFDKMVPQYSRGIAIHGLKEERGPAVLVGGLDEALTDRFIENFNKAGIPARKYSDSRVSISPKNVCNRGANGAGIQMEVPKKMRMHPVQRRQIIEVAKGTLSDFEI